MKKIVVILIALLMLAIPAYAAETIETFQNAETINVGCIDNIGLGCTNALVRNYSGGNSYMNERFSSIVNPTPVQMTYAAATILSSAAGISPVANIALYDSGYNLLKRQDMIGATSVPVRVEVKIASDVAHFYTNGVEISNSAISVNPSYIAFGSGGPPNHETSVNWDDIQWGSDSTNANVIGIPSNVFFILKDHINPAASGLAFISNATVKQSTQMPITFGQGVTTISTPITYPAKNINLIEYATGTVYSSASTGGAQSGIVNIPLTPFLASGAPSGWYAVTIDGSGQYSNFIFYGSTGASVTLDKTSYLVGDTGTATWLVSPTYFDTANYDYKIIMNDIFGTTLESYTMYAATGTQTFSFDTEGARYIEILATKKSDSSVVVIGYVVTNVYDYLGFSGHVYDGNTTSLLSGAAYNFASTAGVVKTGTTIADGNYSVTGFGSGGTLSYSFTKSGYRAFNFSFSPLTTGTKTLDVTLYPVNISVTGKALRGVVHDSVYGNTIPAVTITAINGTESHTVTGNARGYYLFDDLRGGPLVSGRCYQMNAVKTGYTFALPTQCVGV